MRLFLLFALLLAGCAPPPAAVTTQADTEALGRPMWGCQLPFPGVAKLKARGVRVIEVTEPAAIVRFYNETDPVSDLQPDKVYLIRRGPDEGIVALVIGACIVGHIPITEEVMALLQRGGA